ncbi:meiosis 1 arrest protein isoform X2 [Mixophyes fleayi]|uniref:meiosis 1 arrest protein isoform X2 n=1 Tax=Mixophyes fleayi TaxID=3061075 RepID=UPI003F4D9B99
MTSRHISRSTYPRVLLLDTNLPGWTAVRAELCEALGNTFCLSAATTQPGELLSIYIVRERHRCLLPLLEVRGNLVRLQRCLSELRSLPNDGVGALKNKPLSLAVLDSLQQNKQLMQHNSAGAGLQSCFVEVTVVSTRLGHEIASELDDGLKEADLTTLGRLLVLHISCDLEDSESSDTSPGPGTHLDQCSHVYDIEFRVTPGDVLSLESFFKSWLLKRNGEREEIHLILPEEDSELRVICDLHRPLINPGLLPGLGDQSHSTGPVVAANTGVIQTIRVIRALSSHGVCGSMLYGLPSVLMPTACWALDWDQLEANQDHFHALCHCLQSQELSLLACTTLHSFSWAPTVLSHVIVSASDSAALLLRPVAVRELVLLNPVTLNHTVTEKALHRTQDALRCLEVESVYNPLQVTCNLYRHLRVTLTRSSAPGRHITTLPGSTGHSRQCLVWRPPTHPLH